MIMQFYSLRFSYLLLRSFLEILDFEKRPKELAKNINKKRFKSFRYIYFYIYRKIKLIFYAIFHIFKINIF